MLAARALEFHRRATQRAPRDLALWRSWAEFHLRRREVDAAEAVLRAATTADPHPDPEAATLALLDLLAEQRGAAAAEAAALAAIAAQPDTPSLRLRLAALYDEDGRRDLGERSLRELATRAAGTPAALAAQDRLAERAFADGHVDDALSWLARTLQAQPRDGQACACAGASRSRAGRPRPQSWTCDPPSTTPRLRRPGGAARAGPSRQRRAAAGP